MATLTDGAASELEELQELKQLWSLHNTLASNAARRRQEHRGVQPSPARKRYLVQKQMKDLKELHRLDQRLVQLATLRLQAEDEIMAVKTRTMKRYAEHDLKRPLARTRFLPEKVCQHVHHYSEDLERELFTRLDIIDRNFSHYHGRDAYDPLVLQLKRLVVEAKACCAKECAALAIHALYLIIPNLLDQTQRRPASLRNRFSAEPTAVNKVVTDVQDTLILSGFTLLRSLSWDPESDDIPNAWDLFEKVHNIQVAVQPSITGYWANTRGRRAMDFTQDAMHELERRTARQALTLDGRLPPEIIEMVLFFSAAGTQPTTWGAIEHTERITPLESVYSPWPRYTCDTPCNPSAPLGDAVDFTKQLTCPSRSKSFWSSTKRRVLHLHAETKHGSIKQWVCRVRNCHGHLSRMCPVTPQEHLEVVHELRNHGLSINGEHDYTLDVHPQPLPDSYLDWDERRCRCQGRECLSERPNGKCDGIHRIVVPSSGASQASEDSEGSQSSENF